MYKISCTLGESWRAKPATVEAALEAAGLADKVKFNAYHKQDENGDWHWAYTFSSNEALYINIILNNGIYGLARPI